MKFRRQIWSPSPQRLSLWLFFLLVGCDKKHPVYAAYPGYHYRLISFVEDSAPYRLGDYAHVAATFATQRDSVFWDSFNNFNDLFYVRIDTSDHGSILGLVISRSVRGDSACVLVKPSDFFDQQFKTTTPWFSLADSVVKVYYKVKEILNEETFAALEKDLVRDEQRQIGSCFQNQAASEQARDSNGVYWLRRPAPNNGPGPEPGVAVKLSFTGAFLNGRLLEKSQENFTITYGAPDQLLSGLNYVIGRLKLGQNAKIILPSRLAFGEKGSSNGAVPPYTPLVYDIQIESPVPH